MPGIMGPGAVATPEQVVRSMKGSAPGISRIVGDSSSPKEKVEFLKTWGYAIGDSWDQRAKAAWRNFKAARAAGKRLTEAAAYWSANSRFSTEYKKPKAARSQPAPVAAAPAPQPVQVVDPTMAAIDAGSQAQAGILAGLSQRLGKLAAPKTTPIPLSLARQGMTPYGPGLIDAASGAEGYTTVISSLQGMIDQAGRDTEANVKEIEGWYNRIGQSLATAAARDKAIQDASLASVTDAARAVASAIGGEANPGASMAAQAGAQGAGLVQAMGQANSEFMEDIGPLIAAEGVGRMAEARAEGARRVQDLGLQLAQTRAEAAQGRGDALLKLAQLNNELKQQGAQNEIAIRQANQQLRQQDFQNQTGLYGLAATLAQMGLGSISDILRAMPEPKEPKAPKKPTPPSASSLRQSDVMSIQAVAALREQGQLSVEAGVKAVKAAYGISSTSPRSAREAAFRSAARAMPNVPAQLLRRYFSLG